MHEFSYNLRLPGRPFDFSHLRNAGFRHLRAVEWITQAALGAATGEAMLGGKLGNRAMLWGIGLAWLPNLDRVLSAVLPTWLDLYVVDGPGHSLFLAALISFYGGRWLANLWKKQKITHSQAGMFIFAVWLTHVLLAALTVDGAWLLWPVPAGRLCFPVMPQIDLLFTLPLVMALVRLSLLQGKKELAQRKRLFKWGVSLAGGALLLSLALKAWVHEGFSNDLKRREGLKVTRSMEAPASWNRLMWRGLVRVDDEIWVGYRSIFELPGSPVRWTVYAMRPEVMAPLADRKEIKTALWQTGGWWLARPNKKGVCISDLRHAEARKWGDKKGMVDSRPRYSWLMDAQRKNNRLREIQGHADPVETFNRMCRRIVGQKEEWEANPRLAGVPGSLPESLMVHE